MKVYPIGYTHPSDAACVDTLMEETLLIDTRSVPTSRNAVWRQEALKAKYGERYRWLGAYLGNVNYKAGPIQIAHLEEGIRQLCSYLTEGHDLLLLCGCKEYEQCHLSVIVKALLEQLPKVEVIHTDRVKVPSLMALSIIQPYATMLANPEVLLKSGVPPKSIENRNWTTRYRGQMLIHASQRFDLEALDYWTDQFPALAHCLPTQKAEYDRGGFVGVADLVDVIAESDDAWFCGKYGLVLANARPLPFIPYRGQLSLFPVSLPEKVFLQGTPR